LKKGVLYWSKEHIPAARPADVPKRSCMDFSRTVCEVVETSRYRVTIQPAPGHRWHQNDGHGRAGTDMMVCLDFEICGEPPAASWGALFREHAAYGQAWRQQRASQRLQKHLELLGLKDVLHDDSLTTSDGEDDGAPQACPVCLEALGSGGVTPIVRTVCQHHFHRDCLREWAEQCCTCPLCRTVLGDPWRRKVPPLGRRRLRSHSARRRSRRAQRQ